MPTPQLSAFAQNKIYLPFLRHMAYRFTVLKKRPTLCRCFAINLVFSLYLRSPHTSIDGMSYFIESLGCARLKKLWNERGVTNPDTATSSDSGSLQVLYGKVITPTRH